jgi:flagellar biosynthetic protein FlhB
MWLGLLVGPFLGLLFLAAALVPYYQVGWIITTKPLAFNLNKINPVNGINRLFALHNVIMLLMNLAKLAVIMGVAWYTVIGEVQNVMGMVEMEVPGMLVYSTDKVLALAIKLSLLLGVLGYIDYIHQKRKHAKNIRMSKQEIKEEFKQQDGDPMIKNKRRQKQMEMAQRRMMQAVKDADVIVRNPTHYAVALKYTIDMDPAPMVLAKGADLVAQRIVAEAEKHGVLTIENKPLARGLYDAADVFGYIPAEFFQPVAELLAWIYSQKTNKENTYSPPRRAIDNV